MAAYTIITSSADYLDFEFADNAYLHQKARVRRSTFEVDKQAGNNVVEIHGLDQYEVSPAIGGKVVLDGVDYTDLDALYAAIRNLMTV